MKRLFCLLTILTLAISLSSCGHSNTKNISLVNGDKINNDTVDTIEGKYRIGLVMKTLTNPFFVEMENGARKAEKEFNIQLIVKTGAKETSIDQQINIVQDMITSKVDAIVIAPGSSTDLIPILKKAQDAKIPIVNLDNKLDVNEAKKEGLSDVPFISVDNERAAYLSAKYISDKIKKPTQTVVIEGILGTDNGEGRKNGAIKAFNENKNINIVARQTANWEIDQAYNVIKKIYQKYPRIGAVFCANDMMALGVIHFFKVVGKKDVLVAGFDDLTEAKAAIKKGDMAVTIDQNAGEQGYTGVKYAINMIQGKKVPMNTMINVRVVTAHSK